MKCDSCNGSSESANPGQPCFLCGGSGEMYDSCGEPMSSDDKDLGTGSCQECEDER